MEAKVDEHLPHEQQHLVVFPLPVVERRLAQQLPDLVGYEILAATCTYMYMANILLIDSNPNPNRSCIDQCMPQADSY